MKTGSDDPKIRSFGLVPFTLCRRSPIQVLTFDFDKLTGTGKLYPLKLEPLPDKKTLGPQSSY